MLLPRPPPPHSKAILAKDGGLSSSMVAWDKQTSLVSATISIIDISYCTDSDIFWTFTFLEYYSMILNILSLPMV
jgi:hypothetical protein